MTKITIGIDGMMCGMCEAHICDTIRKAVPSAKKVKASRHKKEATFLTDKDVDEQAVKTAVADMGYRVLSYQAEAYQKHGLFGK